jgi:hypothetical protein
MRVMARAETERYHVMIYPELRYQLKIAAACRSITISAMLNDALAVGLKVIEGKPPEKPAA